MSGGKAVAETILAQLGGRRFQVMTGASAINDGGALILRFPKSPNGPNACRIELDPDDTYTMQFFSGFKHIGRHEGVYCDQLAPIFEERTGLRVSLGAPAFGDE